MGGGSEKDLENQEEQEEEEEGDASGNESGEGGGVKGERSRVIDEDDEWHKIQEKINKQKKTPPKAASCTHTIHAPFFPEVHVCTGVYVCAEQVGRPLCHIYNYECDWPLVHLNVSCLIFWSAILDKCMENGQWPPVMYFRLCVYEYV